MTSPLALLILKHDTTQEAQVVRTLVHVFDEALMGIASMDATSQGVLGKTTTAWTMTGILLPSAHSGIPRMPLQS